MQPIEPDRQWVVESCSQQRSGKGNVHHTEKYEQIQPQQPAVNLFDKVQRVVMRDPVNADDDEAQYERSQRRMSGRRAPRVRVRPSGTCTLRISSVITMAKTPSLNASSRVLLIAS